MTPSRPPRARAGAQVAAAVHARASRAVEQMAASRARMPGDARTGARPHSEPQPVTLTIPGPPRTKKNSNRTIYRQQRGETRKFVVPSEAAVDYAARVRAAVLALPVAARRAFPIPKATPVHVCARFYVDRAGEAGDLHGYQQALADALAPHDRTALGRVLADDWQIVSWDGTRRIAGDPRPRTEVTLTPLAP